MMKMLHNQEVMNAEAEGFNDGGSEGNRAGSNRANSNKRGSMTN